MLSVRFTKPILTSPHSEEQTVAILREADRSTVAEVARKHKVSEQSPHCNGHNGVEGALWLQLDGERGLANRFEICIVV